jgi:hypothetical protein
MILNKEDLLRYREIDPTTGCWLWTRGKTTAGYGVIYDGSIPHYVHRVSGILFLDLKEDEYTCHKNICPNKHCFNPDHLYPGNDKSNQEDRAEKINHCIAGHPFTEQNTYWARNAKYPKRQCRECKARREAERRKRRRLAA